VDPRARVALDVTDLLETMDGVDKDVLTVGVDPQVWVS
jgi:hypothetical protein